MGRRTGLDEYDDDLVYRKSSGSRVKRRDERNNNWNSTTSRKPNMNNKDSLSMIAIPTSSRKEIAVPKNLVYSRNKNNSDEERKRNNNNNATTTVINEKGEKINIKSVRVATATPTFDSIRKRQPPSTTVPEESYNNNMNDSTPDFAGNNIVFIMVANNILRRLEELEHQRMDTLNRGYSRCDGVSTLANDDYDIISNSEGDDSRTSNYSLDDEMSFILPKHYRESFIYAVNSRMEALSSHNSSSFILIEKRNDKYKRDADFLTRQCHGMGLGSYDYTVNPILGVSFFTYILFILNLY